MEVGGALLDAAARIGKRALFVVGTGKNAGKTVTASAIAAAADRRGLSLAMTSMGRDGEAADAISGARKPRYALTAGTTIATARALVPAHPATEILDVTPWQSAAGAIVIARTAATARYELAGPPTAAGIRDCIDRFERLGCDLILVDGALDRLAALAGQEAAIVVAVGAQNYATEAEAASSASALVQKLSLPVYDPEKPCVGVEGALTASDALSFLAAGERRQIVVADPTRIVLDGPALEQLAQRLTLRCKRSVSVLAVTVASIGNVHAFDPRAFMRAVASHVRVPVFDLYAGQAA